MNECMMRDLAVMLMEEHNVSLAEALDTLQFRDIREVARPRHWPLLPKSRLCFRFLAKRIAAGKDCVNTAIRETRRSEILYRNFVAYW